MKTAKRLILAAIIAASLIQAATETVYFSENGKTYHSSTKCVSLRRTKEPLHAEREEAEKHGLRPCAICYREHAAKKEGKNGWAK